MFLWNYVFKYKQYRIWKCSAKYIWRLKVVTIIAKKNKCKIKSLCNISKPDNKILKFKSQKLIKLAVKIDNELNHLNLL